MAATAAATVAATVAAAAAAVAAGAAAVAAVAAAAVDIGLVHHSTHMSLTLARLCGEWQLVSGNYEARGASGGKYEARIAIFRILTTVNRFSRISRKAENH